MRTTLNSMTKTKRKRKRKKSSLPCILGGVLFLVFATFLTEPTYAGTYTTRVIKKSEITRIATFPLSGSSLQGNTITKDYYVLSDLKNTGDDSSTGKLVLADRTNCNKVKEITASINKSSEWQRLHMSGLYNKWGSNYVYMNNNAFETSTARDSCYNLATGKKVKKVNCPARPTYVEIPELPKKYYTQSARGVWQAQGGTFKHNGYLFRIIWEHHKDKETKKTIKETTNSYIYVFKNRTEVLQRYKLPASITPECKNKYESEDISVDGDTGDVYIGYNCNKNRRAIIYKIDSAVFGDYTKGSSNKSRKVAVCNGFGKVDKMITVGKTSKSSSKTSSRSSSNSDGGSSGSGSSSASTDSDSTGSDGDSTGSDGDSTGSGKSNPNSPTKGQNTQSSTSNSSGSNGNGCVKTAILGGGGEYCDDGKGSGVTNLLNLVIEIMTIGIGILGVLGITIMGIQYLTAGGNEEKARKAKRRMLEIVIGLALYMIVYALIKFLSP